MIRQHKRENRILVMVLIFAILCTSLPCTPAISVHAAQTGKHTTWYEVSSRINASWGEHIAGEITITNVSSQIKRDWQMVFPWQAQITSMWNGRYEQTEDGYLITPMDYNIELAPEASVSVGFLAEGEDSELSHLVEDDFFNKSGVFITDAEERANMTPSPSVEATATVCETPVAEPTGALSSEPMVTATTEPTIKPLPSPEEMPTAEPNVTVSPKPTIDPTEAPTCDPSWVPVETSSAVPSSEPTQDPIVEPTIMPSNTPEGNETAEPTVVPSETPIVIPTVAPTIVPTIAPTAEPTEEPVEDFYVYTDTVLQEDLVCRNLFLMSGSLECSGYNITVQKDYFQNSGKCSLERTDFTIVGGVRVVTGEMEINDSVLHIGGNFVVDNAKGISFTDCAINVAEDFNCHMANIRRLEQERGSMEIGGNLIISSGSYNQFGSAKVDVAGDVCLVKGGAMYLDTVGESIEIGGDLLIDSSGWSKFCKGQISLYGNLIQTAKSASKSLRIQDGFVLKFCGNQKQKIELAYPETTTLGTLDFRETPEMEVPDILYGEQVYDLSKIGKKKSLQLNLDNMKLVQDEVIDCDNLEWNLGTLRGSGHDLTVMGNLTLHGGESFSLRDASFSVKNLTIDEVKSVYFYEETIKVTGDFACAAAGDLLQYAGETTISGNLTISQGEYLVYRNGQTEVEGNLFIEDQGFLSLQDGSMEIGGDLLIRSEGKSYLDADQILLHGNLIQTEESTWDSLEIAKGCHMVFCGDSKQSIEIAYPYSAKLGTLDFRQAVAVEIPDVVCGSRIYDFSKIGEKESLYLELNSMKLVQDEIIHCKNLELGKSNLSIREYSLTVTGNLTMSNRGDLYCNEGNLAVENLTLENIHDAFITRSSIVVSENLSCASELGMDIDQTDMHVGGNLVITRGNFYGSIWDSITIGGNVCVEGQGSLELTAYHQEEMQMEISGDLLVGSKKQSRLEKGQMTLHGNLLQTETGSANSLAAGNDFILKFCGSKKQKIELAYPESTTLGTMDFRETPGMDVPDVLCGKQVIDFAKIGSKKNLHLELNDMILEQDEVIDCQSVEWIGGSLQGKGYDFTVKGSLTMRDGEGINLHNGKITVDGNMDMWDSRCFRTEECSFVVENLSAHQLGYACFVNSTVEISGNFFCAVRSYLSSSGIELGGYLSNLGKMHIGGDLTMQEGDFRVGDQSQTEICGNLRIVGSGTLTIEPVYSLQRFTILRIDGDLLFDSARQSILRNGRMVVGGNVTQIENEDVDNIWITERFVLELCGTSDQTVDLPGVLDEFNLDLTNSKAVHLKQDFSGYQLIGAEKIVSEEETMHLDYQDVRLTGNGKIPGNLRCYGNLHIDGNTLEVAGKCTQTGYVQVTDGGKLEVSGDYIAEQGRLFISGSVHVKGDVRIKKKAYVTMAGEKSHFLVEGDYISGSRADINGVSDTKGILELKGDLIRKDSALSTGINLSDIHLSFSGDHIQKVQMPESAYFGYIKWLDLQNALGVNFDGITVRAGQITGFSQIQTAGELVLYQSKITLTQNETYSGDIALYDSYLDCNGYEFRITDGGNLEQRDGLVNLDYGTLHVSGDYSMLCNSILQMIRSDDLLQVAGNFSTDSNLSHGSMLRDGRMELWGNFNQGGAPASFGSSDNFVIAFRGNGQRAHFDNTDYSRFANIDPDYRFVSMDDKPLVFVGRMSYHIVKGVLSGIQEALGISELNATAVAFLAGMGIGLTAATVLLPEVIIGALGVLGSIIMAIASLRSMAEAAGGIYSTITGAGTAYDKAEAFAHDVILLVLSSMFFKGSLTMLTGSASLCRSAAKDLVGRKTRLRPSEVVAESRSSKYIADYGDLATFAGEYLDADGLQFFRSTMMEDGYLDDVSELRKVAKILEQGKEKIGRSLTKDEIKAGLDALWNDGGVEGALAAVERWAKGGGAAVVKETNRFVDYINRAGQKIRIPKQPGKTIDSAIATKLNSTNDGERVEAKVANFIKNEMGKELTDFRNKVLDSTGQTIGDIDCGMENVLIEVKKSVSSIEEDQFYKYISYDDEKYINVMGKDVILYIDKTIDNISLADKAKLEIIEKKGVKIVNGLEELKGVLE